jgi:murein DD-endopeptidase MepM/ murein hydrolase activator NlpD
MVKTVSTVLVCGLAFVGNAYTQEVFIGTQKTKPKTAVQPALTDHAKAEKAATAQAQPAVAGEEKASPATPALAVVKQSSPVSAEKKPAAKPTAAAKVAASSPVKSPQSLSHETVVSSVSKPSVAAKGATIKLPPVTLRQDRTERKAAIVANEASPKTSDAEEPKVTAKPVATLLAPAHLANKAVKSASTSALPLAAVPPPSKSKSPSSSQSVTSIPAKSAAVAAKKVSTVEVPTANSEPAPPAEGPKAQVTSARASKPAVVAATKSPAVAVKHANVVSLPEKTSEISTITVAKSSEAKPVSPTKTDSSLKAGSEKSRAMIAGMIAAQAEKQSIASISQVTDSAATESTIPQPVNNHFDTAFTKLADGFDFPIGKPDAEGYYKARGFRSRGHLGEDWDGVRGGDTDLGDPIYSVADGLVVFARDCHMGWGNVLIVRHSYRESGAIKTVDALYGHLNSMLVHRGQAVTRGQKIATMGNAHGLYDAHLHLEIRKNLEIGMSRAAFAQDFSNYYDPTQFIQAHRHLQAGGGTYRVAMNTFSRDARIRWDKTRNYSRAHTGGGTSESAAALKRALAAKH